MVKINLSIAAAYHYSDFVKTKYRLWIRKNLVTVSLWSILLKTKPSINIQKLYRSPYSLVVLLLSKCTINLIMSQDTVAVFWTAYIDLFIYLHFILTLSIIYGRLILGGWIVNGPIVASQSF